MKFKRFAYVQGDSTRGKYLVKGEAQNASIRNDEKSASLAISVGASII